MRYLLYSPDSYGLGHISRSLAIARHLLSSSPGSRIRLMTGAPRAHFFHYPEGCDYVVLPGITKDAGGVYVPADRQRTLAQTVELRARLIEHEVLHFRPDVMLVDHKPRGLCGDLERLLPRLRRRHRIVVLLGLRDVIDAPQRVREAWAGNGTFETMDRCYDSILVYGDRFIFDPVRAYGFPAEVARKTRFVGYVNGHDGSGRGSASILRSLFAPRTGRFVLITLGGGGDGNRLLDAAYAGLERLGPLPPFETLSVTGPLMSPGKRSRFKRRAGGLARLTQLDFTPALFELIGAADLVISMGGYNTICELAVAGANALVVPRNQPRQEQILRARRLHDRGVLRMVEPEEATPERLAREIEHGLEREPPPIGWGLPFTALRKMVLEMRRKQPATTETDTAAGSAPAPASP